MELKVLEVLLCHAQHITAVCQEHVASVAVLGHVLVLAFLEVLQFRLVTGFAGNPACLVQVYGPIITDYGRKEVVQRCTKDDHTR